jgi:hypothetical protein
MSQMLPVPPKSSETGAIMLLISGNPEHARVCCNDAFDERGQTRLPAGIILPALNNTG